MLTDKTLPVLRTLTTCPNEKRPAAENPIPIGPSRFYGNGSNHFRQRVYELLVGPVTSLCYDTALNYFHDNAVVLDVGIGNGYMIPRYHALIKSKGLRIVGVDISAAALAQCAERIRAYNLEHHIELHRASIEDFKPQSFRQFDYIFFSMTFMLLEDQKGVLDRIRQMISRKGEIVFFQTMHTKNLPLMNFIKPKLKYLIGIDFGTVSYQKSFLKLLKERRMTLKEYRLLQKTWFQGEYRIIVASPEPRSVARHFHAPRHRDISVMHYPPPEHRQER
jgi:ubiquinone/menaquinone biosynthesis C-methylase UbiE